MEFCKAFNAATDSMEKGMPIPVEITAYSDKSFTFVTKTPPASYFLKKPQNYKKVVKLRQKYYRSGNCSTCKEIAEAETKRFKCC